MDTELDLPHASAEAATVRALVCGSSRGLGLACAERLAAAGVQVALLARRVDTVRGHVERLGNGAIGLTADLAEERSVDAALDRLDEAWGGVDVVILNSGGPPRTRAMGMSMTDLDDAIDLILRPALQIMQRTVPGMCERGWGRVIAIGSSGVQQPIPGLVSSNTARAGLAAMLKSLAREVAGSGVTVNMVLPGRFATDRVRLLDEAKAVELGISLDQVMARSCAEIPVGRYGDPRELGEVVAFLASRAASYVTGSIIRVDGGLIAST